MSLYSIGNKKYIRPVFMERFISPKAFIIFILVELVFLIIGIMLKNAGIVVLSIVIFVFPGIEACTKIHLLAALLTNVRNESEKLIVHDLIPKLLIKTDFIQHIPLDEIKYVFYLKREADFLIFLKKQLKKYRIAKKECDFTPVNLIKKYQVPSGLMEKIVHKVDYFDNDDVTSEIFMELELILNKYHLNTEKRKKVQNALEKECTVDVLKSVLSPYSISNEDMATLEDVFAKTNSLEVVPFLRTNLNIARYIAFQKWPANRFFTTTKIDSTIVFSNHDGTKKVYYKYFRYLSKPDKRFIIDLIESQDNVNFLMTKGDLDRLKN
jgi:hypothetical protein